jgi:hypothetical protein
MISSTVTPGYSPSHQFISFVEGSSSEAPDPANYSLTVLAADHNLNTLDGGDPTNGFAPWVTDILVYPSSEYWETLLVDGRVRPYIDFSISNYNTLRVPSAVHDYDLYVDTAKFYENIEVDGTALVSGTLTIGTGSIQPNGDAEFSNIKGVSNTRALVMNITTDTLLENSQTGAIINSQGGLNISLPEVGEDGVTFSIVHCGGGNTTTIDHIIRARGKVLAEQYSACTIYWNTDSWYAFGDLV